MITTLDALWKSITAMFLRMGDPNIVISKDAEGMLRVSHRQHRDIIRIKLGPVPKLEKKGTKYVDATIEGVNLDLMNKEGTILLSMQVLDAKDTVAAIYGMVVLTYDSEA